MGATTHALLSPKYLGEVQRLIASDPKAKADLVDFEDLRRRQQVRLAGEWHWIWAVDRAGQRLLVEEADNDGATSWWYQSTVGEQFTVAEPF